MKRRTMLSASLLAVAGCAGPGRTDPSSSPSATASSPSPAVSPSIPSAGQTRTPTATPGGSVRKPTAADWRALARGLDGSLLRPGDNGYLRAHRLYDPRFDDIGPPGVVSVANGHDVAEAVRFAGRFGLGVVSRSGGHSYVGASTSARALVIDVRGLDGIRPDGETAWIGSGADLAKAYGRLADAGRVLPAGTCPSVGIAGSTLGGGIGLATRTYGLTCDAVREVEIVTADGRVRTIDAERQPDLFWACRGGGGGTAGVVTGFRMRTWKSPLVGEFWASWRWTRAAKVFEGWQRWISSADDQVWANLHVDVDPDEPWTASVFGVTFGNDPKAQLADIVRSVGIDPASSYARPDHRLTTIGSKARTTFWGGSDVLGRAVSRTEIKSVVQTIAAAGNNGLKAAAIVDPLGGVVPRQSGTAFPWRDAFGTVQWYAERANSTSAAAARWIRDTHRALRGVSIGAYVNYLEPSRTDARTYFGSNTARLRQVKGQYDPDRVFHLPYQL